VPKRQLRIITGGVLGILTGGASAFAVFVQAAAPHLAATVVRRVAPETARDATVARGIVTDKRRIFDDPTAAFPIELAPFAHHLARGRSEAGCRPKGEKADDDEWEPQLMSHTQRHDHEMFLSKFLSMKLFLKRVKRANAKHEREILAPLRMTGHKDGASSI